MKHRKHGRDAHVTHYVARDTGILPVPVSYLRSSVFICGFRNLTVRHERDCPQ